MNTRMKIITVIAVVLGCSSNVWAMGNELKALLFPGSIIAETMRKEPALAFAGAVLGTAFVLGHERVGISAVMRSEAQTRSVSIPPKYRQHNNHPSHIGNSRCEEARVWGVVDGRTRRITVDVCRENGEWVVQEPRRVTVVNKVIVREDSRYRQMNRHGKDDSAGRSRRYGEKRR